MVSIFFRPFFVAFRCIIFVFFPPFFIRNFFTSNISSTRRAENNTILLKNSINCWFTAYFCICRLSVCSLLWWMYCRLFRVRHNEYVYAIHFGSCVDISIVFWWFSSVIDWLWIFKKWKGNCVNIFFIIELVLSF